ncbi:MAG: Mfa1 family fimbria major subunit [Clostridium sp.]|nr:Mfa1 family fimbria major subunit [Clostridium sp.]
MKNYLKLSAILLATAAAFTACNNDDKVDVTSGAEGEGNIQIKVFDAGARTRAYNGTETAVDGETELAQTLAVYVYDETGVLDVEIPSLTVNPTSGLTETFKVSEGKKYFYIFSNGQTKSPLGSGTGFDALEKQELRVTFDKGRPRPIANHEAMTIGTLWRVKAPNASDPGHDLNNFFDVQPNGYGGTPVQIGLNVGRATAKIRLASISKGDSELEGTFTDPIYRLRSVPTDYYAVGQLDDSGDYPPTTGLRYISLVHERGPGTKHQHSNDFVDYFWDDAIAPAATTHFYAVENTTKKMESDSVKTENLYYGNTTYIQFKVVYTPGAGEVYDPAAPTTALPGGLNTGDNFWTAIYNNQRLIFNALPTGTDFTDIKAYEGGVMYYKFPVRDQRESGTERQCCVIRNHYYEIKVNNIFNLGEPTDEVDPETPIDETDPDVEIQMNVLDWFKVEQGQDL